MPPPPPRHLRYNIIHHAHHITAVRSPNSAQYLLGSTTTTAFCAKPDGPDNYCKSFTYGRHLRQRQKIVSTQLCARAPPRLIHICIGHPALNGRSRSRCICLAYRARTLTRFGATRAIRQTPPSWQRCGDNNNNHINRSSGSRVRSGCWWWWWLWVGDQ